MPNSFLCILWTSPKYLTQIMPFAYGRTIMKQRIIDSCPNTNNMCQNNVECQVLLNNFFLIKCLLNLNKLFHKINLGFQKLKKTPRSKLIYKYFHYLECILEPDIFVCRKGIKSLSDIQYRVKITSYGAHIRKCSDHWVFWGSIVSYLIL